MEYRVAKPGLLPMIHKRHGLTKIGKNFVPPGLAHSAPNIMSSTLPGQSCAACRSGKRKCSNEKPCARCVAQGIDCVLADGTVARPPAIAMPPGAAREAASHEGSESPHTHSSRSPHVGRRSLTSDAAQTSGRAPPPPMEALMGSFLVNPDASPVGGRKKRSRNEDTPAGSDDGLRQQTDGQDELMRLVDLPIENPTANTGGLCDSVEKLEARMRDLSVSTPADPRNDRLLVVNIAVLKGFYAQDGRELSAERMLEVSNGRVTPELWNDFQATEADEHLSASLDRTVAPELKQALDILPIATVVERVHVVAYEMNGKRTALMMPSIVYASEAGAELLGIDRETVRSPLITFASPSSNVTFASETIALTDSMFDDDGTVFKGRKSRTFLFTLASGGTLKMTGIIDGRTTPFYSNRLPTTVTYLMERV